MLFSQGAVASVICGGKYIPLWEGVTEAAGLKIDLDIENPAEGLFSWFLRLENVSAAPSPRIRSLFGLDITVPVQGKAELHTLRGDDCSVRSFFPEDFLLEDGTSVSRSPVGGRSSNTAAFPYFDLEDSSGDGIVFGIGWSGQWKMDVVRNGDSLRITAGFQDCDFILEPNEAVRSVRILLYNGSGCADELRQRFVRLHRRYYSPVPSFDGDSFFPVAASCFDRYYWGNMPEDGGLNYFETEDAQSSVILNSAKCRYVNAFWLDACWFDGAFRTGLGNYRYGEGFRSGLRKLGDLAHRNGMRFILWFEPVRAQKDTELFERFSRDPSKLIPLPGSDVYLVNLGDPEVWDYQFEHISRIIEENGVDIYRQDFNIDPYDYLRSIEGADRIGIAQIRFVEGIYRLWDSLRARFPGLLIDNCSSGGRLLDVETAMRAVPLWRSDMGCRPSPLAMQNEVLTLSRYLPYHQGGAFDYSPYFLRSTATTGIGCNFAFLAGLIDPEKEAVSTRSVSRPEYMISEDKHRGVFDPKDAEESLRDAIRLREYWNGDFTALTPPSEDRKHIVAFTLRLESEDRGAVVIFRREEAPAGFTVKLNGLLPDRRYELRITDEDLKESSGTVDGELLLTGMPVQIQDAPGSMVICYRGI